MEQIGASYTDQTTERNMQYFNTSEFREWYDLMSPRLLTLLDVLRHQLGLVIEISGHHYALGRNLGESESCHNVDKWGEVLAVDCFVGKNTSYREAKRIVNTAKSIGFTGIGVYPYWANNDGNRQCGFHFDVRPTRNMGDPAMWGYFDGKFKSIDDALAELTKV